MARERFMVEGIDTAVLASFGYSLGAYYGGELCSLRDDLVLGQFLTSDDEMFARICRACRKARPLSDVPTSELPALVEQGMPVADYIAEIERRNIDNSGEAPC